MSSFGMDGGLPLQASRWGHHGPFIFIGVLLTSFSLNFARPYPDDLQPLVSIALLLILLNTMSEMRRHDRAMCESCVAAMPLNPAATADAKRHRLAVVHLSSERGVARAYLLLLVGLCLLPFAVPDSVHTEARVLWLLAAGSVAYLMLSQTTHRQLQPWCPQCNQGGGEDVDTPTPSPVDSLTG